MENIHIGIIGGGPSGLISLYECSLRNIKATLYEKENDYGGVWNINAKMKRAHKSTVFNTSSIISSYNCDFTLFEYLKNKYPGKEIDFATSEDYYEYQHLFIERYRLANKIICNTKIIEISSGKNELEFVLKAQNLLSGENNMFVHDYVIIATGLYNIPIVPEHPFLCNDLRMNVDKVWHTSHWDPLDINSETWNIMNKENVRILIVGSGQSAGEAIHDSLSRLRDDKKENFEIFWAPTREPDKRSVWLLDRYPYGKDNCPLPVDTILSRFYLFIPRWLSDGESKKVFKKILMHENNAVPDFKRDRICICETEFIEKAIKNGSVKIIRDPVVKIYKSDTNQLIFDLENSTSIPIDVVVIGSGYNFNDVKIKGKFILNETFLYQHIIPIDESCHGRIAVLGKTTEIGSSFPVDQLQILWLLHQWFDDRKKLENKLEQLRQEKTEKVKYSKQISGLSMDELATDIKTLPNIWKNLVSLNRRQRHLGISYLIGPWSIFQYRKPNETESERISREDFVLFSTEKLFEKCGKDFRFICNLADILYYFSLFSIFTVFYFNGSSFLAQFCDFFKF